MALEDNLDKAKDVKGLGKPDEGITRRRFLSFGLLALTGFSGLSVSRSCDHDYWPGRRWPRERRYRRHRRGRWESETPDIYSNNTSPYSPQLPVKETKSYLDVLVGLYKRLF